LLLQLKGLPVRGLTSVYVDTAANHGAAAGAFAESTARSIGSDVYPQNDGYDDDGNAFCSSGLIVDKSGWPVSPGTVKITYDAGYTDEELHGQSDQLNAGGILSAILETATQRLHQKIRYQRKTRTGIFTPGQLVSETMGAYAYTIKESAATDTLTGLMSDIPDSAVANLEPFVNWGVGLTS